ncbi:MAG: DNA translocase FtsK [Candidatus Omnitrophota bacterium]
MKEKRLNEIEGIVLIAAGLIILASLVSFDPNDISWHTFPPNNPPHNLVRTFGANLAGVLVFLFGRFSSLIIPCYVLWAGVRLFRHEPPYWSIPRIIGLVVLILSASSLIGLFYLQKETPGIYAGGGLGFIVSKFVAAYFGKFGGYVLFISLFLLSLAIVTEVLISTIFARGIKFLKQGGVWFTDFGWFKFNKKKARRQFSPQGGRAVPEEKAAREERARPRVSVSDEPLQKAPAEKFAFFKPKIKIGKESIESSKPKEKAPVVKKGDYHLPSLDLLASPPPMESRQIKEDLAGNARVLEETMDDFGISVKVTDIERGPIITRYELEPAPGVKLNRIVALGDDIALAMKAQSVRIEAPIPGKARVGIEVPNSHSSIVYLKEVLSSPEFQNSDSKLPLALGKDISGKSVISDLTQMPHILIAGTTGSGKTVCVNSLILSLLFKATPAELKMVMVDPKMVELAPFNGLPHLMCPVVTDSKKAAFALNWVVEEMERRYRLLADAGSRNIEAYNQKNDLLPYIILIIDEFADLMVVAREQIESAITRLAQLSRAVGIHLILATQRPSVDVITGVIKANLPARVSFKVASKVDSRTVLDMNGADKLLGRGDMLFLRPQDAKLVRAQGALVGDEEIEKVVAFVKAQGEPVYNEEILKEGRKTGSVDGGEKDEMYEEAVRIVIETNQASVSILQRRLRLGYTRAARIIDMMEQDGLVGPFEGSKARKLLVDRNAWLEQDMAKRASG